jgi:hypothetical protein
MRSPRPSAALAGAALVALLALTPAVPPASAAPAPPPVGALRIFTPDRSATLTVETWDDPETGGSGTYLTGGPNVYAGATGTHFEVDARRPTPHDPLRASAYLGGRWKAVPAHLLHGWHGFADAWTVTWRDAVGTVLAADHHDWCPNDGPHERTSTVARERSRFAVSCGTHPFTRSQRWGIEQGWAVPVSGYWGFRPPEVPVGWTGTVEVRMRTELASFLGVPAAQRTVRLPVHVVAAPPDDEMDHMMGLGPRAAADAARPGDAAEAGQPVSASRTAGAPTPPATAPTRAAIAVPAAAMPDLTALPANGISTSSEGGRDLLGFAADVANVGAGPLVVDGYRRGRDPVMDAHQVFYQQGTKVTTRKVGTLEWDARPSHDHWHFRDFARYDLVDTAGRQRATSGKEAFCLAPTDSIDLLLKGAPAHPGNSDLNTACGEAGSIWVREVLAVGWGDTYTQDRAGQAIDITGLPNGTYRIRVTANPDGRLVEASRADNVSLRTVVLGGVAGSRTVRVPPVGLVDSEAEWEGGPGHDDHL